MIRLRFSRKRHGRDGGSCVLKASVDRVSVDTIGLYAGQAHGKEPWINKRPTSDRRCSDWQRTLSDD